MMWAYEAAPFNVCCMHKAIVPLHLQLLYCVSAYVKLYRIWVLTWHKTINSDAVLSHLIGMDNYMLKERQGCPHL